MADQLKYVTKLQGKRVCLLGGTSGIGFAVAEAVLENGASDIIISSSNPDKIAAAIERLKKAYPSLSAKATIRGYACDLSNIEMIDSNIEALYNFATNGKKDLIDHVVFSAGNAHNNKPLDQFVAVDFIPLQTVRIFGQFVAVKDAVLKGFVHKSADSSITLTSGSIGERPEQGWVMGSVNSACIDGMTRGLALELAPVRVNLVSPGAILTELWDRFGEMKDRALAHLAANMPVGRIGRPEDVAEAYLYSMRDGFITGSRISCNGGHLLKGPGLGAR